MAAAPSSLLCDNTCSSCLSSASIFDEHMIQCSGCHGWTHPSCYYITQDDTAAQGDNDEDWFCSACTNNNKIAQSCKLCSNGPRINAVAKFDQRTNTIAHQCCIMYTGELDFNVMNGSYLPITTKTIDPLRKDLVCYLCNGSGGSIMQCCRGGASCNSKESYFHAICASIENHKNNNKALMRGPITLIDFREVEDGKDIFIDTVPIAYCARHRDEAVNYSEDSTKILKKRELGRKCQDVDMVPIPRPATTTTSPRSSAAAASPRPFKKETNQQEMERSSRLLQAFAKDANRQMNKTNLAIIRQQATAAAKLLQPKPMSPEVAQSARMAIEMANAKSMMMPAAASAVVVAAPKIVWDGHLQALARDEKNQELIQKLRRELNQAQLDLRVEKDNNKIRLNVELRQQEGTIQKLRSDLAQAQMELRTEKTNNQIRLGSELTQQEIAITFKLKKQYESQQLDQPTQACFEKKLRQQKINNNIMEKSLDATNKRLLDMQSKLYKLKQKIPSERSRSRSRSRSRERDNIIIEE